MARIKNLNKLPKTKVTVDDILVLDDINRVFNRIDKSKASMKNIIVIYSNGNDVQWDSSNITLGEMVFMMEQVKIAELCNFCAEAQEE